MIEGSNASALLGLKGMVMTGIAVASEVTITVETTVDRPGPTPQLWGHGIAA